MRAMADFTITFGRFVWSELENLPVIIAGRILERIDWSQKNPRLPGVIKLHGSENVWRLRVGD